MNMEEIIKQKLEDGLQPEVLEVVNESHLHAGHAGDDGSGQTHFRVKVVSAEFRGMSRIEMHGMVQDQLQGCFLNGLHAIAISASAA